jgi:hypothetical protein
MLENMLISDFSAIGSLTKALSGLVLHYGEGGPSSKPSEAAFLSSPISSDITGPPVRVFVSKSCLQTMRAVYSPLGERVKVEPLLFKTIRTGCGCHFVHDGSWILRICPIVHANYPGKYFYTHTILYA